MTPKLMNFKSQIEKENNNGASAMSTLDLPFIN